MKKIVIIFVAFASVFISAEEKLPKDVALAKARYLEQETREYPAIAKDLFGNKYLFRAGGFCPGSEQDLVQSKKVFDYIYKKKTTNINFNRSKLVPFDNEGICTARALDFLARYNTECAKKRNPSDRRKCIVNFKPYYTQKLTVFMSMQSAFNTIELKNENRVSKEHHKEEKMRSLANYHGFSITPVTGTIVTKDLESGRVNFSEIIDRLPVGSYIIRMLHPAENIKGEYYGHTMVFVKDKKLSIYYDHVQGPLEVTQELAATIRDILEGWGIPEFRIYHAICSSNGCINLRNDTCHISDDDSDDDLPDIDWI